MSSDTTLPAATSTIQSDLPPPTPEQPTPEYVQWKKDLITQQEKEKTEQLKRLSHIFHCFDGKKYPTYEDFNPYDPEEAALGYGGAAKKLGFKPALCAKWISENERFKTDINTGILYFFNGKTWLGNAEPYLEHLVNLILGQDAKTSHYRNIEFSLKALTYEKIEFSKKIACENGLLDVETLEFKEYGPDTVNEMPFHYIPVKYDPNAVCPNWEQFVKTVVTPEDITTLQEWSGYCLLPDYRFHKIMWIVGTGRNGKGVWQRTIQAILGLDNVGNIGLEEFDGAHNFSMVNLYGKLVNFCSEPRATSRNGESLYLQTSLLKYATGQDVIDAEIKNKQKRLKFTNCAKITILANRFPRINDQTTAFRERRLFLKFPFEYTGKEQIANIEKNWLIINDERSGILNWMLKGLQRLLSNAVFTTSRTQEQTEIDFLRASDSIAAFINETATFDKHLLTSSDDAKKAYDAYCDAYGLEYENEKRLTAKLKETPHVRYFRPRIDGQQKRLFSGVAFKVVEPPDPDNNQPKEPKIEQKTLETVTGVTGVTGSPLSLDFSKVKKIEKVETPVTSVTSVTTANENSNFETKKSPERTDAIIVHYYLIPPNQPELCTYKDCEGKGARAAQYAVIKSEGLVWYVCRDCLSKLQSGMGVKFVEDFPYYEEAT